MFWIVIKHILKLVLAVAPLALIPWVSKHCKGSVLLELVLDDPPKPGSIERLVGVSLASISVAGMTLYESFAHLWPRVQAKKFAYNYVGNILDDFSKNLSEGIRMGDDIRINVLFARRCWWFPFLKRFSWFANRGFLGGHRDNNLWLLTVQGLCGKAFREEKTLATDMRTAKLDRNWKPSQENLWLFLWQRQKAQHLKAILSIPMFRTTKSDAMTHHKVVGVINVDAVSDKGAEWVLKNRENLEAFWGDRGTTLVWLSVR